MKDLLTNTMKKSLIAGFAIVSCLTVEVMDPLHTYGADQTRSCKYTTEDLSRGPNIIMENTISRYNRGINFSFCNMSSRSYTVKVDCISKVFYALQNDGSYKRYLYKNVSGNLYAQACNKYFY